MTIKKLFLITLSAAALGCGGYYFAKTKLILLEQAGSLIAHPFLSCANAIEQTIAASTKRKISYTALHEAHEHLQQKYNDLFAAYVELRCASNFNQNTEELIDFRQRYHFKQAALGKILARTINDNEHTALINRGSAHGITNDMVAIYKLQIVGRVYECYPTICKIMFMTDKRCKVAGFTNTTSAGGIVVGTNQPQHCEMSFVSHLSEIVDEDFVFSSGQGLVFPEGFCLGKISAHEHHEKELYHTISVTPLVDFQEIGYCLLASREMINLF